MAGFDIDDFSDVSADLFGIDFAALLSPDEASVVNAIEADWRLEVGGRDFAAPAPPAPSAPIVVAAPASPEIIGPASPPLVASVTGRVNIAAPHPPIAVSPAVWNPAPVQWQQAPAFPNIQWNPPAAFIPPHWQPASAYNPAQWQPQPVYNPAQWNPPPADQMYPGQAPITFQPGPAYAPIQHPVGRGSPASVSPPLAYAPPPHPTARAPPSVHAPPPAAPLNAPPPPPPANARRAARARQQAPRPKNCFFKWMNPMRTKMQAENPEISNAELSKKLGQLWKDQPEHVRQHYRELAAEERRVHRLANPGYDYHGNNRRKPKRGAPGIDAPPAPKRKRFTPSTS